MAQSSSYLGVQYNWKPGAASSIASAASSRSSLHVATESNAITQRNQELRRKAFEKRDSNFVITHGSRRHGLRKEVAPYPMSYNHASLDIDTIDHCALWATRGGPSDFDFKEPPKRSLDLGCGHASEPVVGLPSNVCAGLKRVCSSQQPGYWRQPKSGRYVFEAPGRKVHPRQFG
ncbi:hypothetical protein FRC00_007218 [Tulasnella sp. 408]|nr:hypothetical protein FRC00_007218 [Tulasnella sp. 408]